MRLFAFLSFRGWLRVVLLVGAAALIGSRILLL
jgi:hypothetical protein